jgi:hypothetical protein
MSLRSTGLSRIYTTSFPQLAYPYTIGFWIRSIANATQKYIGFGNGSAEANLSAMQRPSGVGGYFGFTITGAAEPATHNYTTGAPGLSGLWRHVLFADRNATTHIVYLDGKRTKNNASWNSNVPTIDPTTEISIFAGPTGSGNFRYAEGYMEGLTFWNQALSDAEIYSLAMRAHPLNVRRNAIIACYPEMGQNNGVTVPDYGPNGYDLTQVSGTGLSYSPDGPGMGYETRRRHFIPWPQAALGPPPGPPSLIKEIWRGVGA